MGQPSHRQFLTSFHGADTTYIRILFFTDYSYLHLILCIKLLQKIQNIKKKSSVFGLFLHRQQKKNNFLYMKKDFNPFQISYSMYIVYINNTFHLYIHNALNIQTKYYEYTIHIDYQSFIYSFTNLQTQEQRKIMQGKVLYIFSTSIF